MMDDFQYPYISYPNRSNSRYRYNNPNGVAVVEVPDSRQDHYDSYRNDSRYRYNNTNRIGVGRFAEPINDDYNYTPRKGPYRGDSSYRYNNNRDGVVEIAEPIHDDYILNRYDHANHNDPLVDPVVVVNRDYLSDNRHRPPSYYDEQPEITELKIRRDVKNNAPTPIHDQHVYDTTPITEIKIKRDIEDRDKKVDFQNQPLDFDEVPVKPLLHNPFLDENYKPETPKPPPTVESKVKTTPKNKTKPSLYSMRKNKVANKNLNDSPRSNIETKDVVPTKTSNKNTKKGESFEIPLDDNINNGNIEKPAQRRFVTMKLSKNNSTNNVKENDRNIKPKSENNSARKPVNVNSSYQPENQQYGLVLPQNQLQLSDFQYPVLQYPQNQQFIDPTTGYVYESPINQPQAVYQMPVQETQPKTLPQTVINTNYVIIQPKDENVTNDNNQNSSVLLTNRSQSQSLPPPEIPQIYQNVQPLIQSYPDGQYYQTNQPLNEFYPQPQIYQQPLVAQVAQEKPKDVYNITRIAGAQNSPAPLNASLSQTKQPKEVNYEIIKRKKPIKTIVHHYFK